MNIIEKIKPLFILSKSFVFSGSKKLLIEKLHASDNKDFYINDHKRNVYEIKARIAYGTLRFSGGFGAGISVNLKIEPKNEDEQIITIYTELRPENYFLLIFAFFTIISIVLSGASIAPILISIVILPVMTVWFNFIYKVQEESLIDKIKKRCKLKDYKGVGAQNITTHKQV